MSLEQEICADWYIGRGLGWEFGDKKRGLTLIMIHRILNTCDEFECNYSFEILVICLIFLRGDFIMLDILLL